MNKKKLLKQLRKIEKSSPNDFIFGGLVRELLNKNLKKIKLNGESKN